MHALVHSTIGKDRRQFVRHTLRRDVLGFLSRKGISWGASDSSRMVESSELATEGGGGVARRRNLYDHAGGRDETNKVW